MPNANHPVSYLILPHWRYQPKLKGLSGLYLNTALRNFALGLSGIFIPIYVYQLTHQLSDVLLFYLLRNLALTLTLFPAARFISRWGPDLAVLLSNFAATIFFFLLATAPINPISLWLAPLFAAFIINFYWPPYHAAFSSVSSRAHLSRAVANINNITRLVSVFAPLVGGIIATQWGFSGLLLLTTALFLVSSLPIFLDEYNPKEPLPNWSELEKEVFLSQDRSLFFSFFFQGFRMIIDVAIWPIILYLAIPSLEGIGGLTTFTLIVSLAIINYLAKKMPQFNPLSCSGGNLARTIIWTLRGLTQQPLIIALTDPFYQLATIFVDLPRTLLIYHWGKKQPLSFFVKRELSLHLGRLTATIIISLLLIWGLPWQTISILAVWATIFSTSTLLNFVYQTISCKSAKKLI